jgi:hypothetical protein
MARVSTVESDNYGDQPEMSPPPQFTGAQSPGYQLPLEGGGNNWWDSNGGGINGAGLPRWGGGLPQSSSPQPGFDNTGISGYGRGGNSAYQGFNQNAFEQAFGQATAGKSGTLAEWQQSIFPSLQSMFPDIQSFGSKGDKIRLPNGQVIDAVVAAGAGGRGYGLNYTGGTSDYFSDPVLQGFMDFGQGAIDKLMGPQTINPVLQQAIDALTKMSSQGAPQMDMSWMAPLQAAVQKRQAQIDQPGYSPAQQDILRTQVTDPLEAQRSAAKQQVMEHMAARGIQPGSGIMEQALMDVDRQFSQMRTGGERDLATKEMAQDEARKQEAVQINQILAQLGLSGSQANLQGQIAGRGQNMGAAGQLAGIGSQLQDEPIRNLMSAMGIYGNMAELPFKANANAIGSMNAINNQNVPQANDMGSLIQLLLGLSNQGENVYQNGQQTDSNFWNVLGGALPDILKSFSGLFGPGSGGNGSAGPAPAGGGGYG